MRNQSFPHGFWKAAGVVPLVLVLALIPILASRDSGAAMEAPLLLAWLNTIIMGGVPLAIAFLAARSYLVTGAHFFLMLGCGLLSLGVSSLLAGWAMPLSGHLNATVTLHNLGCLVAGVCHLLGAHYLVTNLSGVFPPRSRPRRATIPYLSILAFWAVVLVLALRDKLPAFFIAGGGPTPLRQFVLGEALLIFAVSGVLFLKLACLIKTDFAYWYGLALLMIAGGLAFVLLQPVVGGILGWAGRSAQYLGILYFICALWRGRVEFKPASQASAPAAPAVFWPFLEQQVKERTSALEQANENLRREIAARQQADAALRASEEKFHTLFKQMSQGVFYQRADGSLIDANPAALRLFGLSREEFLTRRSEDRHWTVIHEDDSPFPAQEHPSMVALRTGQPVRNTVAGVFNPKTQDFVWLIINATPQFRPGDTAPYQVFVTLHDITERKRVEVALRESEERYHALFSSSLDAALLTAPDGGVLAANEAACRLFGHSEEELVRLGRNGVVVLSDARLAPALEERARTGKFLGELMFVRKDGTKFLGEISSAIFHDLHGQPRTSMFIRDITERTRAEADLRASREQLRALASRLQAAREEERCRIAREIHDVLAQELTRLKIDLAWLQRRLGKPVESDTARQMSARVTEMTQAADAAITCVQEIATELRPVVLDSLGLAAAVEWHVRDFQRRTGIQCEAGVPEEDVPLNQERATVVYRILQEALTNVARHAQASRVDVGLRHEAGWVVLTVRDNGRGMEEKMLGSPLSIGLAGMRERAALPGGQLEITSQPGAGTRVTARIPVG